MIGSLDCTHTFWKNCPKAWQGSYKGKESKPSIIMESIADYFLFLWHASYGYTGTLNDNTILHLTPFLDRQLDGTFHDLEAEVVKTQEMEHLASKRRDTFKMILPNLHVRYTQARLEIQTETRVGSVGSGSDYIVSLF
jgi:hypothetical protein